MDIGHSASASCKVGRCWFKLFYVMQQAFLFLIDCLRPNSESLLFPLLKDELQQEFLSCHKQL